MGTKSKLKVRANKSFQLAENDAHKGTFLFTVLYNIQRLGSTFQKRASACESVSARLIFHYRLLMLAKTRT